jgi:hypothetical protein
VSAGTAWTLSVEAVPNVLCIEMNVVSILFVLFEDFLLWSRGGKSWLASNNADQTVEPG